MNVRIGENQLRFRITKEELGILLDRHELSMDFNVGGSQWRWIISMAERDEALSLVAEASKWQLVVDRETLVQFAALPPSREGIVHQTPSSAGSLSLTLMLEVDLRRPKSHSSS